MVPKRLCLFLYKQAGFSRFMTRTLLLLLWRLQSSNLKKREKRPTEAPPRVARVLKLVDDEDDLEAREATEVVSVPVQKTPTLEEDSEVKVIEVPLVRKMTLKKAADAVALEDAPAAVVSMANFLTNRRKQIPHPSVLLMAAIEAFLANEPVEAVSMNVIEPVAEEPIQVPAGPIPSVLCHPLGSNIQHILEDIDMDSEESVGIRDNQTGPPNAVVKRTPRKPLSPIPEAGASSRAPTPTRPRSPILDEFDRASRSKRPRTSEASGSESSAEIQPEGVNWMIGGKLAKLGGDLKGNPFKAMVDLIDHEKLQMKRDIFAHGIAEEMLSFQFFVSVLILTSLFLSE